MEVQGQIDQTGVGSDTQGRQHDDGIAARAEFPAVDAIVPYLREKLAVALLAAEETDEQHPSPVDSKQGTNTIKFGREDPQDDECEGEL